MEIHESSVLQIISLFFFLFFFTLGEGGTGQEAAMENFV